MIYIPLEHIEQRYTFHLDRDILKYLNERGIKYSYLDPTTLSNKVEPGMFLNAPATIYRQLNQMKELIEKIESGEIKKGETIFCTDIWNIALLAVPYLNFFSHYGLKIRGIVHAGSFTDTDFVRQMERVYKGFEESIFDICDKIYVGSQFIKNDILQKRYVSEEKIVVTGLPLDFERLSMYKNEQEKEPIIVFNGRNVDEKQPYLFDLLQKRLPEYKYVNTQKENLSKEDYYALLAKAKCVVSFALQENFGYGVQEAVYLGCVPAVPNRLAYVEQFNKEYRYNSFDECVSLVDSIMKNEVKPTNCFVKNNEEIFDKWFENL